jgi:hypothetical protein
MKLRNRCEDDIKIHTRKIVYEGLIIFSGLKPGLNNGLL